MINCKKGAPMFVRRILTLAVFGLATAPFASLAQDPSDLAARAQAILRDRCFECHGADPKEIHGELKVLERANLLDSERKLVVAGQPKDSELMRRVDDQDEDNRMPPTPQPALSAADKQILRDWIT